MNELFANATVDALRKLDQKLHEEGKASEAAPIVWVHDYQLMLAANTIRYRNLSRCITRVDVFGRQRGDGEVSRSLLASG